MAKKALEGIRVVDLTTAYSGPFCTMQLADFGAEVVKVEHIATGDPARQWTPLCNGESVQFVSWNRNKKSICLDLKSDEGHRIFLELVKTADVVVENFRPGVTGKLGIGYEDLRAVKPDLIMASLSGFGQSGPYSDRGCYSNIAEALSGVMYVTGYPDGKPTGSGVAFGDSVSGLFTAQGILVALLHRERTGEGQHVDVSMADAMFAMLMQSVAQASATGEEPERLGTRDASMYPYDLFEAKDGYCILTVTTVQDWTPFLEATGLTELASDPRFDTNEHRVEHADELYPLINAWSRQHTRAEIEAIFLAHRQGYAPVLKVSEAMENEHYRAHGMVAELSDPVMGPYQVQGIPVRLSATPGEIRTPAPQAGAHTDALLEELGYSKTERAQLRADGVVR